MLRMVVFDFDGVIADTEKVHFETFRQTLHDEDIEINWSEYCQKYLGYTDWDCIERILNDYGCRPNPAHIDRIFQSKKKKFARCLEEHNLIMPGVRKLLENLRGNHIICAICSGALAGEIEIILRQGQLRDFFAVIISAEDVTHGKPSPEGYLLSIAQANTAARHQSKNLTTGAADDNYNNPSPARPSIRPNQCVVIEDSIWGIHAAHAAQMPCLALTNSYPAEMLREADLIVKDLTCLNTEILRRILK